MEHFINVLKGVVIGIANAIPGVSGGTMMVIMKVFDKLLAAVSIKNLKKNIPFLLTIGLGMAIGVILSAKVLTKCFELYYVQTQLFFLGVIIGSLPMIYKEGTAKGKFKPLHLLPFIIGIGTIIFVSIANPDSSTVYTELTVSNFIYLVIVSIIAAAAMLMPGLSGSLVLLMLGGYQTMLQAVDEMNIPILMPIGIGVILGIVLCAKAITLCLKKCYKGTYAVILGMIVGSLYAIFPYQPVTTTEVISGIITCIIGIALPLSMTLLDKKKGKNAENAESATE